MRPSFPPAETAHDAEIHGIDALEIPIEPHPSRWTRVWRATWPVLAAIALFLLAWQAIMWSGVRPPEVLPGPVPVFKKLAGRSDVLLDGARITLTRAVIGFSVSLVVGTLLGIAVAGNKTLRTATGSLITGLQTMPSIAWFPLAILLFALTENAILFVMVLGAAPAIANGLIVAIDHIPPILLSAGKVLGATGIKRYRYVVLPAAFPSFVGGMKQGWAFLWRSLMAGEILFSIANRLGLGTILHNDQVFSDAQGLLGTMIVILAIGIVVDRLVFARIERSVRVRWGLGESL